MVVLVAFSHFFSRLFLSNYCLALNENLMDVSETITRDANITSIFHCDYYSQSLRIFDFLHIVYYRIIRARAILQKIMGPLLCYIKYTKALFVFGLFLSIQTLQ